MQRQLVADLGRCRPYRQQRGARANWRPVPASTRQDESATCCARCRTWTRELNVTLRTVRDSSTSIHTASVEITRGNYDLSSRTEETCQLTGSRPRWPSRNSATRSCRRLIRRNRGRGDYASLLGRTSARRGGSVVAKVVSTMDEILADSAHHSATSSPPSTALPFSDQPAWRSMPPSRPRAPGEQGRGFAVVASRSA